MSAEELSVSRNYRAGRHWLRAVGYFALILLITVLFFVNVPLGTDFTKIHRNVAAPTLYPDLRAG
jgi:hypothetical protein